MSVGRLFEQNNSLQNEAMWHVNLIFGVLHCSKDFKDKLEGLNLAEEFSKQNRHEKNVIDEMHHQICTSNVTYQNYNGVLSSELAKISAMARHRDQFYQEEKDKKVKPAWSQARLYGKTIEPIFFLNIELLDPTGKMSPQCFDTFDSFNAFIANGCKPCAKEATEEVKVRSNSTFSVS